MKKTIYSREYDMFRRMFKEERERLGLTQTQLGTLLGTHQPFVARIEAGQRRLDLVEFIHIMRKMGVVPTAFLKRLEGRIRADMGA